MTTSAVELLEEELKFFEEQREELVKHHLGKFALIKGSQVMGVFDSAINAYEEGVRLLGSVPMLIQQVEKEDQPIDIPAYRLGLM